MANIKAGTYSVRQILNVAKFDFATEAAAEYLNGGPDYRRVKVGGLGFDDLDQTLAIPVTADELVITLDGEPSVTLKVTLDATQEEARKASFESAADVD